MNSTSKSNSLMGDLESIKALLEEDDLEPVPEALSQALNPPVSDAEALSTLQEADVDHELDEAIDRAIDDVLINESFEQLPKEVSEEALEEILQEVRREEEAEAGAEEEVLQQFPPRESLVSNASLDALLGEDFHDATAEVMQRARGLINQHANEWSPQQTDELADALRVRIDGAVEQWIQTSLAAHAGELQQRLLNAVRNELARHLEAFESN